MRSLDRVAVTRAAPLLKRRQLASWFERPEEEATAPSNVVELEIPPLPNEQVIQITAEQYTQMLRLKKERGLTEKEALAVVLQ